MAIRFAAAVVLLSTFVIAKDYSNIEYSRPDGKPLLLDAPDPGSPP